MDEQQIRITRDNRDSALGCRPGGPAEVLPHWTGLRLVRYRLPVEHVDRHVKAPHPILTLVCEGEASTRLRMGRLDTAYELQANDLMFYSGGKEIDYSRWQARDAALISVEFDPARLHLNLPPETLPAPHALRGDPKFNDAELAILLRLLWQEGRTGGARGRLYTDSLCLGLTTHVFKRFSQPALARGDQGARLNAQQVRHLDDYIDAHLAHSIGLDDLAQAVGLSRYHFSRVFTNTLGDSPYQYVIRKRLERAYRLLVHSDMPMTDVALSAGFSSQAHFSALCRRELGATPRSLRQQRA